MVTSSGSGVEVRPGWVAEPDDGTLFLTVDGTGFSLDRLTQLVREYVKASGTDKEGACHLFRHTLATLMLEGGADIRYIQAMLGRAELSTTQIYTQVSIRALQAVHAATFPGASNRPRRNGQATLTAVESEPTRKVSPAELLAAINSEIEEENRGHPGSTGAVS
jgi:integrase/recombinase XerD